MMIIIMDNMLSSFLCVECICSGGKWSGRQCNVSIVAIHLSILTEYFLIFHYTSHFIWTCFFYRNRIFFPFFCMVFVSYFYVTLSLCIPFIILSYLGLKRRRNKKKINSLEIHFSFRFNFFFLITSLRNSLLNRFLFCSSSSMWSHHFVCSSYFFALIPFIYFLLEQRFQLFHNFNFFFFFWFSFIFS